MVIETGSALKAVHVRLKQSLEEWRWRGDPMCRAVVMDGRAGVCGRCVDESGVRWSWVS